MTKYVLPDLRYDYGDLEPHVSGKVMELHHSKHHRAYVTGANQALEQLAEARAKGALQNVAALEYALAFNVSGHILHSLFWQNLSPDGGGEPTGELAEAIARDFGSLEALKNQMNQAAATTMGSGWAALVWDPVSRQLVALQIHDHQMSAIHAGIPLLVMDAWEHAYYLQYQTEKNRFFSALWNLWDWEDVAARYAFAQRLDLKLPQTAELAAEAVAPAPH